MKTVMDMQQPKTTVVKLMPDVFAIDQEMVRSFLILGAEKALLIDTGAADVNLPALAADVTGLPVTLCLTHSDGDHTAALKYFKTAFAHPDEIPLLREKLPQVKTGLIGVEEGHVFDLGGRMLEVVFNPGHSPGSISLLDRKNKLLFSGDTVSYGPVFMFGAHRNPQAFIQSMKKLQKMSEDGLFDVIYPCHNTCPVYPDCISELLACMEGILDGTLEGEQPRGMLPPGASPLQYTVGKSGIFYAPPGA